MFLKLLKNIFKLVSWIKKNLEIFLKKNSKFFVYISKNKFMKNKYIQVFISFLIIFIFYKESLLYIYLKSLLFFCLLLFYKYIIDLSINNKNNLKKIFINYEKINIIGLFIYKWSHIYFIWLEIQKIIIKILRRLRYILRIKLNLNFIMKIIDKVFYFIMFVLIESVMESFIIFSNKIKQKIIFSDYKELLIWRLNILLIYVLLIYNIIKFINWFLDSNEQLIILDQISIGYIITKTLLSFLIIILLQSLVILIKNIYLTFYSNYDRFWQINIKSAPFFIEIHKVSKIYENRYLLINCSFLKNTNVLYSNNKYTKGSLEETGFIENIYWFDNVKFEKDIYGNINVIDIMEFFLYLNTIIAKIIFFKWHLNLFLKIKENEKNYKDIIFSLLKIDMNEKKI